MLSEKDVRIYSSFHGYLDKDTTALPFLSSRGVTMTIQQLQAPCCKFCPLNFKGLTVIGRVTRAGKVDTCGLFPRCSMTKWQPINSIRGPTRAYRSIFNFSEWLKLLSGRPHQILICLHWNEVWGQESGCLIVSTRFLLCSMFKFNRSGQQPGQGLFYLKKYKHRKTILVKVLASRLLFTSPKPLQDFP